MQLDTKFIDPIVCYNCNSTTSFRVPVFTSLTIVVVKVDLHVIRKTQNFKVKNKKMVTGFVSDLQRLLKVSLGWKYPSKFICKIRISKYVPYVRHYKLRFVYSKTTCLDHFFVFKEIVWENSVLMYDYEVLEIVIFFHLNFELKLE